MLAARSVEARAADVLVPCKYDTSFGLGDGAGFSAAQ